MNIKRSPVGGNASLFFFFVHFDSNQFRLLLTEICCFHRFLSQALKAAARLKRNREDPALAIWSVVDDSSLLLCCNLMWELGGGASSALRKPQIGPFGAI